MLESLKSTPCRGSFVLRQLSRQPLSLVLLGLCAGVHSAWAQQSAPNSSGRTEVVAVIDGKPFTGADVEQLRRTLPSQYAQNTAKMTHRQFLEQYRQLLGFTKVARENRIDEMEPYKTQLEFNTMNYLAQVYLTQLTSGMVVTDEDRRRYYDENQKEFQERGVSAIYLDYSDTPGAFEGPHKPLSRDEAIAKANDLVEQLKAGADFAELARKHSTDESSAAKGGDLGVFTTQSSIPNSVKQKIFELELGETSEPILEAGRYYIFKLHSLDVKPFDEVKGELGKPAQNQKLADEIDAIRQIVSIEFKNEEFLKRDMEGIPIEQPRLVLPGAQ